MQISLESHPQSFSSKHTYEADGLAALNAVFEE